MTVLMDLSRLLGTRFECGCGRTHHVPIRELVYEPEAVDSLPEILRRCLGEVEPQRVAVVADVRTWDVCGGRAEDVLREAGLEAGRIIVQDRDRRGPLCDDVTCRALVGQLRPVRPDVVVAVGSGVINDLCKWASFELGVPYVVVATAASMNGYSAANVAPTIAGVKVLVEARPPLAVIAEPRIVEAAPRQMTTAGFGDTIAKHQSNADWIMNHLLLDEYHCGFCAGIVGGLEPLYLDRPEDIREGSPEAVKGLFEALFWTGTAMTLVGTSAPASGGEHLVSHTLDMMAEARGESHDLHGRQVGLGTLFSAALYERVLAVENPVRCDALPEMDAEFWMTPGVAAAVREQYEAKIRRLKTVRQRLRCAGVWDRLRAALATQVKGPATIHDWLTRAGAAATVADIGCSRERFRSAVLHMHEIRRRFSIIDLARLAGVMPDAVDDVLDEWLSGAVRL